MRHLLLALPLLLGQIPAAQAQVSVGIGINVPGVSIGINMPAYPQLVAVPGYPVYYAPGVNSNYFFYDGLYWVFQGDNWYSSGWYNGPWQSVGPEYVPLYVLRVPVRYYRQPPVYFRGWRRDAPPQWGDHWGRNWEDQRRGWNEWDHRKAPPPAPLPVYQRNYSGDRYPQAAERQREVRSENYRYQPREAVTQQHYQQQGNSARYEPQPVPVQQRSSLPPPRQPQREQEREPQGKGQGQGQEKGQGQGQGNKGESQGKGHDKKND